MTILTVVPQAMCAAVTSPSRLTSPLSTDPRYSQSDASIAVNDPAVHSKVAPLDAETAENSSGKLLAANDQAQNDWQAGHSAMAESDAVPAGMAFERGADLKPNSPDSASNGATPNAFTATPVSRAALEEYKGVQPPARLAKCVLFSASLCVAVRDKSIVALTAAQTGVSISDGVTTTRFVKRGYVEVDPLSRILLGRRPSWARMAPMGAAQILASAWLAGRMKSSSHIWMRRLWWLPQIMEIGVSAFATENNLSLH